MPYITTPIYYVNDKPHIGHAYTTIACDVWARWQRLMGRETFFLTGTDEHGQKVQQSAEKAGISPQAFTDDVSQRFRDLANDLDISHDDFIRTTEPRHHQSAQAFWQKLVDAGAIYEGKYAGWYSVKDEQYFADNEIVNGKAPSGHAVEWLEEPSYFFRLSDYGDRLLKYIADNPDFIAPESRKNEVIAFIKDGLQDLSISRTSFNWGIKVPGDDKHVMYVWIEALSNYLTALGYPRNIEKFWPADVHVVGKDILRFHAVYWPAFLVSADLPLPKRIFAHGWWTNEGQKISKSLGNVIDPYDLIERYGLDPVRYFLLREIPFGNDGNFSKEAIKKRVNSDLANDYGNLCQRVLAMIVKNCDGRLSDCTPQTQDDSDFIAPLEQLPQEVDALMQKQAFHKVLELIWQHISNANRYIDAQAPWKLKKTDPVRMHAILSILVDAIRRVTFVTQPFMPNITAQIFQQLNTDSGNTSLSAGHKINQPVPLFQKIEGD
ncbi:MAG: methionine--tRNA ligase [Cyanobacteria bacterium J06621_8]